MILIILFISAFVLGLIFMRICSEKCWDLTIPVIIASVGFFGCFICGILIPCERTSKAYNDYYEDWNRKYLGLEARIKAWNNGGEDPYLWDDVKEFNSSLENAQYWANNYWTNWMNECACNKFEIFDIPNYERGNE